MDSTGSRARTGELSHCTHALTCTSATIVHLSATPSNGQVRSATVMEPAWSQDQHHGNK
jgi:hypothetical protein